VRRSRKSNRSAPKNLQACLIKEDTMRTRTWFGAIFTSISVCLLLSSPMALADKGAGAEKLEGAWVAKVIGFPGQWSYVAIPDSSGRRASGHGSVDVGFDPKDLGCDLELGDHESPILVNIEMTGPDTARAYSIWYALRNSDSQQTEIMFIGEVRSEFEFVAPGRRIGAHYFAFYLPSQDMDPVDGLPDEGELPACAVPFPITTLDTRLPAP
jgi:hypothetical protein